MGLELYDIHSHSGIQRHNIFNEKKSELRINSIPELLEAYKDRIDKIVNFPMPGTVYFNYDGSNVYDGTSVFPYQVENAELINMVEKYDKKGKILPFLCINPKVKVVEQLESLYKFLNTSKVFGLKFHTLDTNSGVDDLFSSSEIISFCREYKLPMIIHSGNFNNVEDCRNIFEYAEKNIDINFCIAHLMTFSKVFFEKLKNYQHNNIFTDVSPFLGLCKFAKEFGSEDKLNLDYDNPRKVISDLLNDYSRFILWGSDEPFGNFKIDEHRNADFSLDEEIDFLFSLEEKDRNKIASENSERFLFSQL